MHVLWLPPPAALPDALSALHAAAGRPVSTPGRRRAAEHSSASSHDACYDDHFGVARSPHAAAELLAAALRETTAPWWRVPGTEHEVALEEALPVVGLPAPPRLPRYRPQPLTRWLLGHRLFFALTQATIVALRDRSAGHSARAAAVLLRSCAAAMRLTAGFDPADYERTVRPSMTPAAGAAPGFSGLWSADHRALVAELRHWDGSHGHCCPDREELRAALAQVHDAHYGVCARFVGHRSSLLTPDADALATLEHLAATRRNVLDRPSNDGTAQ